MIGIDCGIGLDSVERQVNRGDGLGYRPPISSEVDIDGDE